MATSDELLITDIIDLSGIGGDTDILLAHINRIERAIQDVNKKGINIGQVSGMKELKDATDQLVKATNVLTAAINDTTKARRNANADDLKAAKIKTEEARQTTEAAKAKREEAKASVENARAKTIENKERDSAAKSAASEQKIIDQIANEYGQLSKAYNEASLRAKNMAIVLGANHPLAVEAATDAKKLGDFLKQIDASVGQNQRNVGNYASGFDSLKNSMQQLLRETPALAINLNTFFLAISNNLPVFFDAIQQAKKANVDLAASGEKPVPVLKQIVSGLFSLQSALTIGVTLLTLFGGKIVDWVASLFQGEDQTKKINRQIYEFNQTIEKASKQLENFTSSLEFLQKLSRINIDIDVSTVPQVDKLKGDLTYLRQLSIDQLTTTQQLEQQEKTLQKTRAEAYSLFLSTLTTADQALLDQNGGLEAANFISDQLSKNAKSTFEASKKADEALVETQNKLKTSGEAQRIIYRQIAQEKTNIDKEQAAQTRKLILETINSQVDIEKTKNQAILSDDRSSLSQRLNALKRFLSAENAAIEAQKNDVLANPESSPEERAIAVKKANAAAFSAQQDYQQKVFELKESFRIRDIEAEKQSFIQQQQLQAEAFKTLADNSEFNIQDRLQFQKNYFDAQKAILDEEYRLKKEQVKNTFQTDAERLAIETDYETKVLQLGIEAQKGITSALKTEIEKQQAIRENDVDAIKAIYSRIDLKSLVSQSEDIISLNNQLKDKTISYSRYIEERKKLDQKYKIAAIENLREQILTELKLYDGAEQVFGAAEIRLAKLKDDLNGATTNGGRQQIAQDLDVAQKQYDIAKKNIEKKKELIKGLTEADKKGSDESTENDIENQNKRIANLQESLSGVNSLFGELADLAGAFSERIIQGFEAQKDALEDRYKKEVDFINQTVVNQTERDRKLLEAQKRYDAQKKVLEDRERQEKLKQARFEKAATIASIILNTAAAVVADLKSPISAIKIPFDIAIGAAQLAVAIATPLPRFFKGKNIDKHDDNYQGWGIVDDGGRPEAVIRAATGDVEIGGNNPRVTWLNKDDIVLPDARAAAIRATASAAQLIVVKNEDTGMGELRGDIKQGFRMLNNTVKNKKEVIIRPRYPIDDWIRSNRSWDDFMR